MELTIAKSNSDEGAFSTVIFDYQSHRAYKLFKSEKHSRRDPGESLHDNKCREVFAAELKAYQIAASVQTLKEHTPEFYGTITVDKVLDSHGSDLSPQYLLDCCYCMKLCVGTSSKLGMWLHRYPYLQVFADLMRRHEIGFTNDCSVFSPDSAANFVLIDFATHDAAFEYDIRNET